MEEEGAAVLADRVGGIREEGVVVVGEVDTRMEAQADHNPPKLSKKLIEQLLR